MEVGGGDVGPLDAARLAGGGEAVLVGDERVPAQEAAHPHLAEGAGAAALPGEGEAVRVLRRVGEADRLRVGAGPLDVAPEVALPAEREEPSAQRGGRSGPGTPGRAPPS